MLSCITPPDGKSGGDGERHQAKIIKVGQQESDSVNYGKGDRTDWRKLDLEDSGFLTIIVDLDDPKANVEVGLYNCYGKIINKILHRKDDPSQIVLTNEVGPGRYFIKVQAVGETDKTGYGISVVLK